MRIGGARVTLSLLDAPKISAPALIRLLPVLIRQRREKWLFDDYMSRCARVLTENTAKLVGGRYMQSDLDEILRPKKEDTRSCEEITTDIVRRCGLVVEE